MIFSKLPTNKNSSFYQKVNSLIKNKILVSIVTVVSGTALAQLITMLSSPIITRIFGPESFGILGVFNSILTVVMPIAALTYPIAIVLPEKDREAKDIARLSMYISTTLSTFLLIILLFFNKQITEVFKIEEIRYYLYLIPVAMFFDTVFQVIQQWIIRKKQFNIKAKISVLQAFIINTIKVGIGLIYPSATTLVLITSFSKALNSFMLAVKSKLFTDFSFKKIKKIFSRDTTNNNLKYLSKKYKDFPIYRAPEVLVNGISAGLPVILLTILFGPVSAGFFTLATRVLFMPVQLIGNSVGDVFYPHISALANQGKNIQKALLKANFYLALVGLIPFGIIVLIGPTLFGWIFGSEWVIAGEYARWLAIWNFFTFITRPTIKTLPVIGAQRFHLVFTVFNLSLKLISLIIGFYLFTNDQIAIALYSIISSLLLILLSIITLVKSKSFAKNRFLN